MILNFENKLNNEGFSKEYKIEDLKVLQNIIYNKDALNTGKTKIIKMENYLSLFKIINKSNEEELINFFSYFNKTNIQIHKIIINGYIEFDIDEYEDKLLEIISKIIDIYFSKNIFYFIYKKLSKIYRRHDLIKNEKCIKKINKIFNVWKFLYNPSKQIIHKQLNNPNFIFLPKENEENKNILIEIKEFHKMKNILIIIDFIKSPILNLNILNEKFCFIKFLDSNKNKFELKYNDIITEESNNNSNIISSFSQINQIEFFFTKTNYQIDINNKTKIIEKKDIDYDFNKIRKIQILNNFYGEISSLILEREYSVSKKNSNNNEITKFRIEIEKDISNDKIKINISDTLQDINENEFFFKNRMKIFNKYNGILFYIKINYNNIENILKPIEKNLFYLEYYGGMNCFMPLFKIIKYIIDSFGGIVDKKIDEKEKEKDFEKSSKINEYVETLFIWIKDIMKIILKLICISEKNYSNFKKIIIPLIVALSEILHSLNNLISLNLIPNNNKFNDEAFHSLYIILLVSSIPMNIKKMYQKIISINDNLDNLICTMDSIIFDIEKTKLKNVNWYFTIIILCIEFIMIYFNSSAKVSINLMNQLEKIISFQNLGQEKEDKITVITMKILYEPINKFYNNGNMSESILSAEKFLDNNKFYLKNVSNMLNAFLNIKQFSILNKINLNNNSFYIIFLNLFLDTFDKKLIKSLIKKKENIQVVINNIKNFPEEKGFLNQVFPFLKAENFISQNELLMNELIDYHSQYHKLMKELFIYNRFWSNQKMFYTESLNERKESNIKYKNINYYTRNFQRPIIYPVLDYKYRYPLFYDYTPGDCNMYNIKEIDDDYNFDYDSPELDKYIYEYNQQIFQEIEKNGKINTYYACLLKQLYHVRGILFIVCEGKKIILYFYSYPDNIQKEKDRKNCCNKRSGDQKNSQYSYIRDYRDFLCHGSLFKCSKKEGNRIIKINLNTVRMIIKRIYYYRKSAIEIFTEAKSYYFNFASENKVRDLFILLIYPCEQEFFPINIKDDTIGYMRLNPKIIEEDNISELVNKKNNFIGYISNKTSMGELCEMCVFDIILLINLISNRSYNDLHQYPIFPILYFCDKENNIIIRDLKEHVGFQEANQNQIDRKNLFHLTYRDGFNFMDQETESKNNTTDKKHLFNTHYSNIVYTSNFMMRLFPYSFSAIEMQGGGFDSPNRLFHYIQDTFYNIGVQKSDLRELIPEFFYLPEMFININAINFKKKANGQLVDDVVMPDYFSERNNYEKLKKYTNFEKIFIFVDDLKTQLEYIEQDMSNWINLIFGTKQRFSNDKKQFFRKVSYIDLEGVDYQKYVKDDIIMNSCDFGIMPLQTIFDNKILDTFKNRKNTYENIEGVFNEIIENKSESNKTIRQKTVIFNEKKNKSKYVRSVERRVIKIEEKNIKKVDFTNIDNKNKIKKGKRKSIDLMEKPLLIENKINDLDNKNNNINNINISQISKKSNKENNLKKANYIKNYQMSDNYFNEGFWDEEFIINFVINNNYDYGKLEVYYKNVLIAEIIDHNDKINDFFYNRRLNMFATSSFDGFACIYILPNKLFTVIKNKNNTYFDRIFLCSNPFPTIITFEQKNHLLRSYSLSGLFIRQIIIEKENNDKIEITPILNIYGGNIKDQVKVSITNSINITNQIYSLPLFDLESEEILVVNNSKK